MPADTAAAGQARPRFSVEEIKRRLTCAQVALQYGVKLTAHGRKSTGLCPFHSERTASFGIDRDRELFYCFGCGAGGDVLELVRRLEGLGGRPADFGDILAVAAELAGYLPDGRATREALPARRQMSEADLARRDAEERAEAVKRARAIWREGRPAKGTPVEVYLGEARKIPLALIGGIPPSLRYHPALYHADLGQRLPAMVGGVQGPDGQVMAVHRTYLTHDGRDKARCSAPKKMLGPVWGGGVRLGPATATLNLAEGIETGLTVAAIIKGLALKGLRADASADAARAGAGLIASVWAALSLGNLAGGGLASGTRPHPERRGLMLPSTEPDMTKPGIILPPIVKRVIIWLDEDNKDPASAAALADRARRRYEREGREVEYRRPEGREDFNSWLMKATP
jgi:DNA primase